MNLVSDLTQRQRTIGARTALLAGLVTLAGAMALMGCSTASDGDDSHKVNGSVHVVAGKPTAAAATVNGSIEIDADATVTSADTVNGHLRLGAHATADSLRTVNGSITLEAGARVAHGVESVNGSLTLHDGADVLGPLVNVNGKIELDAAHVAGGIKTVNGSMSILGASRVEGGISVQKASTSIISFGNDVPRIVIGPGATVQGDMNFERPVKLYLSDKATVGSVIGTTPIPFTGDVPPA